MTRTFRIVGAMVALGVGVAMSGAAADQNHGTSDQQAACTPDVFRLCGNAIPDEDRIVGCLRQNTAQLSSGCRAVFNSNDSMTPPRGRSAAVRDPQSEPQTVGQGGGGGRWMH
ncbi:MAG: hypothetical protein P4M07_28590 [Xanthobacteraceae bacterium]|nr:hypothetical protein [Xanthobacteraceae bacterium]